MVSANVCSKGSFFGAKAKATSIPNGFIETNLMFTMSGDKDQRKNSLSSSLLFNVNEPLLRNSVSSPLRN